MTGNIFEELFGPPPTTDKALFDCQSCGRREKTSYECRDCAAWVCPTCVAAIGERIEDGRLVEGSKTYLCTRCAR